MATIYDHIDQNKRRTWLLVLLFPASLALLVYLTLLGLAHIGVFSSAQATQPVGQTYQEAAPSAQYVGQYIPTRVQGTPVYLEQETPDTLEEMPAALTQTNRVAVWLLPLVWGVALCWILIVYFSGDQMLLRSAEAIPITKEDQPEIYRLVENVAITRGLPVPHIYIIKDDSLNAFATGRDPQHASIALTKGIVQKLDRLELEGVIAHEMAHVENRDIRLMLITVAGISFFTLLGEILLRMALVSRRSSSKDDGKAKIFFLVGAIVCFIYGYLIAPLIHFSISRTREFQADATAALTTRNPAALASALRKISQDSRVEVLDAHESMSAMCIANPLKKEGGFFSWVSGLYATHPPVQARIDALVEMDGRPITNPS